MLNHQVIIFQHTLGGYELGAGTVGVGVRIILLSHTSLRTYWGSKERRVSIELSPKANPFDVLFQRVWFRLMYLLFWAIYITVFWFVLGPASKVAEATIPWYAVSVGLATCAMVPALLAPAIVRGVPLKWFRVHAGERVLYRMLGVGVFGWLLDISGWNRRVLEPLRGFTGKRAGLLALEQSLRAAAVSHGIGFAVQVLLSIFALLTRLRWSAALWMLLPGVVLHLYPVLLQRSIMLRLQSLLGKIVPSDCDTRAGNTYS